MIQRNSPAALPQSNPQLAGHTFPNPLPLTLPNLSSKLLPCSVQFVFLTSVPTLRASERFHEDGWPLCHVNTTVALKSQYYGMGSVHVCTPNNSQNHERSGVGTQGRVCKDLKKNTASCFYGMIVSFLTYLVQMPQTHMQVNLDILIEVGFHLAETLQHSILRVGGRPFSQHQILHQT